MKPIHEKLTPTDGYITSFTRNTIKGWWEVEVGLPASWVFDENSKISCEVVLENDIGKLIKVFPKKNNIYIDDLITFVEVVIQTNEKIAEKEKQFTDKMQEMKGVLEQEASKFYKELEELKENSFKKNNSEFDKNLGKLKTATDKLQTTTKLKTATDKPKTTRKPRAPRTKTTEKTEDIKSTK